MRLVVWNANMAVHRKLDALAALRPDIAVIPECADPTVLASKASTTIPPMIWIGNNPNKGLGVFAFGGYSIRLLNEFDPRLEWIAPVSVEGALTFTLLAAWCKNHRASQQHPLTSHRRQVEPALSLYSELLDGASTVVAGDLNNNVCWDVGQRGSNFSNVVNAAGTLDLVSAYHQTRCIEFGAEPDPTLYWQTRTRDGRRSWSWSWSWSSSRSSSRGCGRRCSRLRLAGLPTEQVARLARALERRGVAHSFDRLASLCWSWRADQLASLRARLCVTAACNAGCRPSTAYSVVQLVRGSNHPWPGSHPSTRPTLGCVVQPFPTPTPPSGTGARHRRQPAGGR